MGNYLSSSGTLGLVSGQWLGFLTPEVSLPIYTHSMWIWDYAHSASLHLSGHIYITTPLTHLGECGFYKSLVVGLPYSCLLYTSDAADDPRVV